MKKVTLIILSIIFLSGISSAFADNTREGAVKTVTLSGKVVDKTNQETLAGALITIEGSCLETYTDFEGNFTISGLLPDTYTIKCSMISYSDREEQIEIDETTKDFEIKLENFGTSTSAR